MLSAPQHSEMSFKAERFGLSTSAGPAESWRSPGTQRPLCRGWQLVPRRKVSRKAIRQLGKPSAPLFVDPLPAYLLVQLFLLYFNCVYERFGSEGTAFITSLSGAPVISSLRCADDETSCREIKATGQVPSTQGYGARPKNKPGLGSINPDTGALC